MADVITITGNTPMGKAELRLLHEIGRSDGRRAHNFRKRPDFRPGDLAYFECECGAQSGRFWNLLTQEEEAC